MLYFARAREATGGMTEESFEVGGAADTDTLRAALVAKHPSLESVLESCVLAVNQEYATENTALGEGCEVGAGCRWARVRGGLGAVPKTRGAGERRVGPRGRGACSRAPLQAWAARLRRRPPSRSRRW